MQVVRNLYDYMQRIYIYIYIYRNAVIKVSLHIYTNSDPINIYNKIYVYLYVFRVRIGILLVLASCVLDHSTYTQLVHNTNILYRLV